MTRSQRQGALLIALVNVLLLAVAATAVVDLRRLQTPQGTALRWVEAAVFGDCGDYLSFSVVDPSRPELRSRDKLCQDLRAATAASRADPLTVGLRLKSVRGSVVDITLTRKGVPTDVVVHLVRAGGHWRVLLDATTCDSVGCA